MTDLDRKIAELKGWAFSATGLYAANQEGEHIGLLALNFQESTPFGWSTDIAKAFELVDEVCGPRSDRVRCVSFAIVCAEPGDWRHFAKFFHWAGDHSEEIGHGDGATRPEAICRAYIALKEWERARR